MTDKVFEIMETRAGSWSREVLRRNEWASRAFSSTIVGEKKANLIATVTSTSTDAVTGHHDLQPITTIVAHDH